MDHSPSLYFYHLNKMTKCIFFTHDYVIIFYYNKSILNICIMYMYYHSYTKWKNPTNQKLQSHPNSRLVSLHLHNSKQIHIFKHITHINSINCTNNLKIINH